jgi:hypothetical protein
MSKPEWILDTMWVQLFRILYLHSNVSTTSGSSGATTQRGSELILAHPGTVSAVATYAAAMCVGAGDTVGAR